MNQIKIAMDEKKKTIKKIIVVLIIMVIFLIIISATDVVQTRSIKVITSNELLENSFEPSKNHYIFLEIDPSKIDHFEYTQEILNESETAYIIKNPKGIIHLLNYQPHFINGNLIYCEIIPIINEGDVLYQFDNALNELLDQSDWKYNRQVKYTVVLYPFPIMGNYFLLIELACGMYQVYLFFRLALIMRTQYLHKKPTIPSSSSIDTLRMELNAITFDQLPQIMFDLLEGEWQDYQVKIAQLITLYKQIDVNKKIHTTEEWNHLWPKHNKFNVEACPLFCFNAILESIEARKIFFYFLTLHPVKAIRVQALIEYEKYTIDEIKKAMNN